MLEILVNQRRSLCYSAFSSIVTPQINSCPITTSFRSVWVTCGLSNLCIFALSDVVVRIAGSDTSSISLSYFFWELSRRPDILKKLQDEIDEVMPDSRAIPDFCILQELPYLSAFIKEGLI
jgi:hypothetical protein